MYMQKRPGVYSPMAFFVFIELESRIEKILPIWYNNYSKKFEKISQRLVNEETLIGLI